MEPEETQALLITKVEEALGVIWLARELGGTWASDVLLRAQPTVSMLDRLVDDILAATAWVDSQVYLAALELAGVAQRPWSQVYAVLSKVLRQLGRDLSSESRLHAAEVWARELVEEVRIATNLEAARGFLALLDRLACIAVREAMRSDWRLSKELRTLVHDFDRGVDESLLSQVYRDIKGGLYPTEPA